MLVSFEEIRLDLENAVEIEGTTLQDVRQRHLAALSTVQLGIGVDATNPRLDFRQLRL
jgi:hypothetical protein